MLLPLVSSLALLLPGCGELPPLLLDGLLTLPSVCWVAFCLFNHLLKSNASVRVDVSLGSIVDIFSQP